MYSVHVVDREFDISEPVHVVDRELDIHIRTCTCYR